MIQNKLKSNEPPAFHAVKRILHKKFRKRMALNDSVQYRIQHNDLHPKIVDFRKAI